jgi:hypothetical protein
MRFSKSTSKLKVGAEMAAGQVGGTSVFICDVPSTCGVHQGTRNAKTEFSMQEPKFGNHADVHLGAITIGTRNWNYRWSFLWADGVGILNRPGNQRRNWERSGFRIQKFSETANQCMHSIEPSNPVPSTRFFTNDPNTRRNYLVKCLLSIETKSVCVRI